MFNNNMMITAACGCNTGKRRRNNEDNFYFAGSYLDTDNNALNRTLTVTRALREGCCLAIFDGMGGEDYGEVAANTAAVGLSAALAQMKASGGKRAEFLYNTAQELNNAVFEKTIELGAERVGCTMAALLFERREVYLCSVGDSRAYRLRSGELKQLSVDDVVAGYKGGGKAPLTQHIGMDPGSYIIEPHIGRGDLKPGDVYLICSDGLTDMLDEGEILAHLEDSADVKTCVERLIADALKNGGRDNVTVILARIEKGRPWWQTGDKPPVTDTEEEEPATEKTEKPEINGGRADE